MTTEQRYLIIELVVASAKGLGSRAYHYQYKSIHEAGLDSKYVSRVAVAATAFGSAMFSAYKGWESLERTLDLCLVLRELGIPEETLDSLMGLYDFGGDIE
jgi:hypothetical protein